MSLPIELFGSGACTHRDVVVRARYRYGSPRTHPPDTPAALSQPQRRAMPVAPAGNLTRNVRRVRHPQLGEGPALDPSPRGRQNVMTERITVPALRSAT